MAYDTNALGLMVSGKGANQGSWWGYMSADAATVVRFTGYISDGDARGMEIGDIVIQSSPAATLGHIYVVKSVAAGGAADLTDGTAITITDTD